MAIAKMRRMTLIGLDAKRADTVDALADLSCAHIIETRYENIVNNVDEQCRDEMRSKMSKVCDCLSFIKLCGEISVSLGLEKKAKNPYKGHRVDISFRDLSAFRAREEELLSAVAEAESLSETYFAAEGQKQKIKAEIAEIAPYLKMDMPFSAVKDTAYTSAYLGVIPLPGDKAETLLEDVGAQIDVIDTDGKSFSVIYAVCLKTDAQKTGERLAAAGLTPCRLEYDATPSEQTARLQAEYGELDRQSVEAVKKAAGYFALSSDLKILHDYYDVALRKSDADGNLGKTKKTFLLEAWVPADKEDVVARKMDEILDVKVIDFRDPLDDEKPPTLTVNNKIVAPYEEITNMYSVPDYRERDPNSFVAVFFFVFFGVMLGDAGYGILLTIGALLLAKIIKPAKGMRNLIYVIAMGGISTVFWGIMFGGWFSIDTSGTVFEPLLFSPLDNPIGFVAMALALGAVQICTGMVLSGVAKWQKGSPLDGILDDFLWVLFFAFGGVLAVGMALGVSVLGDVGLYGMLGSLALVLFTAGRHKKGFFGKVVGGLGGLYKVIGFVSDLLSYLRLFGLGLATGVIGMVFNEIAGIFTGPIGVVCAVIVLLVGHTLNVAVNVLGAYVHDSRLQFIEFFSRFYTGEGYLFSPIVGETKYTNIN